nr:L703 [uncultured bacterium]
MQHAVFAYGGFKIFEISKIFTRLLRVPLDIKDLDLRQTRSIVSERIETKRGFSFSDSFKSGF